MGIFYKSNQKTAVAYKIASLQKIWGPKGANFVDYGRSKGYRGDLGLLFSYNFQKFQNLKIIYLKAT